MIEVPIDVICNIARVSPDFIRDRGKLFSSQFRSFGDIAEFEMLLTVSKNTWSSADMMGNFAVKLYKDAKAMES